MANLNPFVTTSPGKDYSFRALTCEYQSPAYSASLALLCQQFKTVVNVGQLTGDCTITIDATNTFGIGSELTVLVQADGSTRTVVFSTGFVGNGQIAVPANGYGIGHYTFNGYKWIGSEVSTATSPTNPAVGPGSSGTSGTSGSAGNAGSAGSSGTSGT